jgi:hypothetical protein
VHGGAGVSGGRIGEEAGRGKEADAEVRAEAMADASRELVGVDADGVGASGEEIRSSGGGSGGTARVDRGERQ